MALIKGIGHIMLTVSNVKKSREFYQKAADLKVLAEDDEGAGLTDGKFSLWLHVSRDYKPKELKFDRNQLGLDHLSFAVKNIDELRKIESNLKSLGAEMEDGGITDDGYGSKDVAIFVKDPDGMKVEFKITK